MRQFQCGHKDSLHQWMLIETSARNLAGHPQLELAQITQVARSDFVCHLFGAPHHLGIPRRNVDLQTWDDSAAAELLKWNGPLVSRDGQKLGSDKPLKDLGRELADCDQRVLELPLLHGTVGNLLLDVLDMVRVKKLRRQQTSEKEAMAPPTAENNSNHN